MDIKGELRSFRELVGQMRADFDSVVASTGALIEKAEKGRDIRRDELEKAINEASWLEVSLRSLKEMLRARPRQALRSQKD